MYFIKKGVLTKGLKLLTSLLKQINSTLAEL